MDGTLHFKLKGPLPSGFILQKDVHISNILFANSQIPINQISKLLPFRPPTGRIPQDPSSCLQVLKINNFYSLNPQKSSLFYLKKGSKNKKSNNLKLKFPFPRYKLMPITAMNFHSSLTEKILKIKYLEDDLNITSKKEKKLLYSFNEDYYFPKFNIKEKIIKPNILKNEKEYENKNYNNYFDFGFHSRNSEGNIYTKATIFKKFRNKKSAAQRPINMYKERIFSKDKTFQTQIDFNLLDKYKKINRAQTAKIKSNKKFPINN